MSDYLAVACRHRLAVALEDGEQLGVGEVDRFLPQGLEPLGLQRGGDPLLHVASGGIGDGPSEEVRFGRQGILHGLLGVETGEDLVGQGGPNGGGDGRVGADRHHRPLEAPVGQDHVMGPCHHIGDG